MIFGKVIGIFGYRRHNFLFYNTLRNIPVWTKYHIAQLTAENGRTVGGSSHYYPHVELELTAIIHMHGKLRNIHQNIIRIFFGRHPANSFEVNQYLPDSFLNRHIKFCNGFISNRSLSRQSHSLLIFLNCGK